MRLFKRVWNRSQDYLFLYPGFEDLWLKDLRGKATCILYHRVDEPDNNVFLTRGRSPVITPEGLKKELQFLVDLGSEFYTFRDLRNGKFPGQRQIGFIITFDDCFLDNYTHGLEVLEDLGIKGVFFQCSGMIDADTLLWEHALYWYTRDTQHARKFAALACEVLGGALDFQQHHSYSFLEYLKEEVPVVEIQNILADVKNYFQTQAELRQVSAKIYPRDVHLRKASALGHEIGSHGHNHYFRKNIDDETFEKELAQSRAVLESVTGEKPLCFSYPFNSYFVDDAETCATYYSQIVTVNPGRITPGTDPRWLPRFTWPGPTNNALRQRRWLLRGRI